MGGQGEMLSAALSYANVAFSGAISICMLNLLGGAVRGTGNMTPAFHGHCQQRVRAHSHLARANLRRGSGPWARPGRRPLGAGAIVLGPPPRAGRLPALLPLPPPFGAPRRTAGAGVGLRRP